MPSPSRHFRGFTIIELPAVRNRGFTIIELMVAISIIAILIAILIPAIGKMGERTSESAAINVVSITVEMARYYSTQSIAAVDPPTGARFSGAAALFHPAGEIRVVQHEQRSRQVTTNDWLWSLTPARRGYVDVGNVEYVRIPKNVGVFGIARDGGNTLGDVQIFNPPFAISFNENGQLTFSNNTSSVDHYVYYNDGITGTTIDTSSYRSSYDPKDTALWGWESGGSAGDKKYGMPFQKVTSVVGVLVVENPPEDVTENGTNGITNATVRDDLLNRGRVIFFNRYTGAPLRDMRQNQ